MDECLFAVTQVGIDGGAGINVKAAAAYSNLWLLLRFTLITSLDTDERRRMAQNPHEYLIEQLQFTGDESIGSSSAKLS